MAYEIVKFTDDAGESVTITPADVKQVFCPGATDKEVQLFLALCSTKRLNPFTREAYLVKYGSNPAQMITSRAAFQKRADASEDYEGTEFGVVVLSPDGTIQRMPGEAYYPAAGQQLIGGWASVHRRNRKPYYAEVALQEYNTGKSNWARMPGTMIAKVAEVHALRNAFPAAFDGMYAPEEMDQAAPMQAESVHVEPAQTVPVQQVRQAQPAQPSQPAQVTNSVDEAWVAQGVSRLVAAGYSPNGLEQWLRGLWQSRGAEGAEAELVSFLASAPGVPDVAVEPDEMEAM